MNAGRVNRRPPLQPDLGLSGVAVLMVSIAIGFVATVAVLAALRFQQRATISIVDTSIGDCFVLPISGADTEIYQVELVDCAEPHDVEVVGGGELNPGGQLDYPADEALLSRVEFECGDPRRFHDIGFGVLAVAPNELTWRQHRGTYVCLGLWMDDQLVSGRQIPVGL